MTACLPALDRLRAVAAPLVVATHAAYLSGFMINGGLAGAAGRGTPASPSSSPVLLPPYFRLVSDACDGRTDVKAYAVRRAARVLRARGDAGRGDRCRAAAGAEAAARHSPADLPSGADIDASSQSRKIPTVLSFYLVPPCWSGSWSAPGAAIPTSRCRCSSPARC